MNLFFIITSVYSVDIPQEILGEWKIDPEGTFEQLKKFKGYKIPKEELKQLEKMKKQMSTARFTIEQDKLTTYINKNIFSAEIEVLSYKDKTLEVKATMKNEAGTLAFSLIDKKTLHLKRTGEPIIVLKRKEEDKAAKP